MNMTLSAASGRLVLHQRTEVNEKLLRNQRQVSGPDLAVN